MESLLSCFSRYKSLRIKDGKGKINDPCSATAAAAVATGGHKKGAFFGSLNIFRVSIPSSYNSATELRKLPPNSTYKSASIAYLSISLPLSPVAMAFRSRASIDHVDAFSHPLRAPSGPKVAR